MCRTISVLAILMALLSGCSSTEQTVLFDDLQQRNGAIYYQDAVYTGVFIDGKPHGPITKFYADGTIEEQGQFHQAEAVGKWLLYYNNGALARESFHKNDRPDGQWTYFNEDGTIKQIRTYKNGQRI